MKKISVSEAAEILGVSKSFIFKRIRNGHIAAEKVGHMFVIDYDVILKLKKIRKK